MSVGTGLPANRSKPTGVRQLAAELGVLYVLEGSVRRMGVGICGGGISAHMIKPLAVDPALELSKTLNRRTTGHKARPSGIVIS